MIEFEKVSKRYDTVGGRRSLRGSIVAMLPLIRGKPQIASEVNRDFWALRDVSFHVGHGEALGIVGHNGAGKTTTLKLLSNVTTPTTGRIHVNGRVSALIELGAGFHPELTGTENTFLYGTILGLTRRQVRQRLDSIVSFAELHAFMDMPVKHYSSGMYARLAFSVAAHVDPDVLLVDEVLSVGDAAFQQKCLDFLHTFVNSGKTAVFVSHSLMIGQLCKRIIWLDHGRLLRDGPSGDVLSAYMDASQTDDDGHEDDASLVSGPISILGVRTVDGNGSLQAVFQRGEDVVVEVEYETNGVVERPHFVIWVSDSPAPVPVFAANMLLDGGAPEYLLGRGVLRCRFKSPDLMPKQFHVWLEAYAADGNRCLVGWRRFAAFRIVDAILLEGLLGHSGALRFAQAHAPVRTPYEWDLDSDGRRTEKEPRVESVPASASAVRD